MDIAPGVLPSMSARRKATNLISGSLFGLCGAVASAYPIAAGAQQPAPEVSMQDAPKLPPLTLRSRIALPGVYGRMDHYGWDSKRGILFVTALGNNTVEIVDQWRRVASITGLEHPQASQYV